MNYNGITRTLLYNGIRFRSRQILRNDLDLSVVSLALTHRCNSHCVMCNLWKRSQNIPHIQKLELSKKEILGIFSRPLFSHLVELDLTGGEPHLREDFAEIVLELASLKTSFLPRLKSIIITSNGLLADRIISNYRCILTGLKISGIDLVSVNSLDGMNETHDLIRGTKGAFNSVNQTIQGLMEIRKEYNNFFMGLKTTILPQNVNDLEPVLEYALRNNLFHIISPVFFTSGRFENLDKLDKLNLTEKDYHSILKFYRRQEFDSEYYYHQAKILLSCGSKGWCCTAGSNYLFIEFDGQAYPCELTAETVGDLRKQDIDSIWTGAPLKKWRQRAGCLKICSRCCEPGAIRYSAYDEGLSYRKFLMKLGGTDYRKSLVDEGYIKYFS